MPQALVLMNTLLLVSTLSRAQTPIRLSGDDVQFQFGGAAMQSPNNRPNPNGKPTGPRLCGFMIQGNHLSRANPHVEWDFNIDQIVTRDRAVAGFPRGRSR